MNIEKDVYQIQKLLPLSIKTGQESDIGGSLGLSPPIISGNEDLTRLCQQNKLRADMQKANEFRRPNQ